MLDKMVAGLENPYANLRAPGQVQSFGAMLALHPTTLRVLNASQNVAAELGVGHADILGKPLFDLLEGGEAIAEIKDALQQYQPVFNNPILASIGGQRFDLSLHCHDGLVIAEFERLAPGAATEATTTRISMAISSMPTSAIRMNASTTTPLSRMRSMTSARLLEARLLLIVIAIPFNEIVNPRTGKLCSSSANGRTSLLQIRIFGYTNCELLIIKCVHDLEYFVQGYPDFATEEDSEEQPHSPGHVRQRALLQRCDSCAGLDCNGLARCAVARALIRAIWYSEAPTRARYLASTLPENMAMIWLYLECASPSKPDACSANAALNTLGQMSALGS